MDVFLMVRRKKTTIFLDAKETTSVLTEYGLNSSTAKAQAPATVGLAFRDPDTGKFEPLEVTPLSSPPELPDVMKPPESQTHEQTVA
ncbi:hypothetical protein MRX96_023815 [Rhipicephalus microplus]